MSQESFRIVDLSASREERTEQAARLLFTAFRDRSASWPDIESARHEVLDSLTPGRLSRVAIDDAGDVLGWIGGQPQYEGAVWELHPLVVAASARRRGVGRALVLDLEARAAERGALTLWLGSDDELGETSLGGADLYADLPAKPAVPMHDARPDPVSRVRPYLAPWDAGVRPEDALAGPGSPFHPALIRAPPGSPPVREPAAPAPGAARCAPPEPRTRRRGSSG